MRAVTLIVLVTSLLLMAASPAAAHVPDLEPAESAGPDAIAGPEVSRAIYGYLAPGEVHDEYRFRVGAAVTRSIGVIVPAYPEHVRFRPTLVILGGDGTQVSVPPDGRMQRRAEFEPFSLTHFWTGSERQVVFKAGTEYTIRVEPGAGSPTGRYVVVFGGPERFEGADVSATLGELPAIWFGAYGAAPPRWNWLAAIPLGLIVGTLGTVAIGLWRRLRATLARPATRT